MKTLLPTLVLACLALAGCGSKDAAASGPMDANRPATPPAPTGNGMSVPPPTSATGGTTGG